MIFLDVLIFAILLECQPVQGVTWPVKTWRAKHWPNQRFQSLDGVELKTISKNYAFHLKNRQSFTDRFGNPTSQPGTLGSIPVPQTDRYGTPVFACKDEYGSQYIVPVSYLVNRTKTLPGRLLLSSMCDDYLASLTTSDPTSHPPTSNPEKLTDMMTYVYIGAGLATLLLVTGALIFLVMWAQKRKTRQRVNNTDSL